MIFTQPGDFAACRAAEAWLTRRGFSVGHMQAHHPRGILLGDYNIQKWRNLSAADRLALHALMTGDMRNGPVYLELLPNAPPNVCAAFWAPDEELVTPLATKE